jgi:hypothetical protein
MSYKIIMWLYNCVKTNPVVGNLVYEFVLEMSMNELCSWKLTTWVELILLALEGYIKNVLNKGVYHMSGAKFVVLEDMWEMYLSMGANHMCGA